MCPYQGDGQYWHLVVEGTRNEDAAWSLSHPLPEAFGAAEHVSSQPSKIEVRVDGQRLVAA